MTIELVLQGLGVVVIVAVAVAFLLRHFGLWRRRRRSAETFVPLQSLKGTRPDADKR